MRALLLLLVAVFSVGAATNVQHTQVFTGGTNNDWLASSVLNAGSRGSGSWDLQSGFTNKFQFWKVGTNFPFQLPYWFTIGGTNYESVPANWVYYDLRAYTVANEWEQYRYTAPGGGAVGTRSNLWVTFYLFLDGVNSANAAAPNLDPIILNGIGGGFCAMQLSVRTNGLHEIMAHGQITNGWKFAVQTNILYMVSLLRKGLDGTCECQVFNPTNNFQSVTNEKGGIISQGDIGGNDTNAYEIRIGANYLNSIGGSSTALGRISMSSPIIGFGNTAYPPTPDTNVFHADRYFPLVPNVNAGFRGSRPYRTLETNVSTYANYSVTNIGPALSNAIFFAASNTVVVLDGTNHLRNFMQFNKDGVTLRGTNNATIVFLDNGDLQIGPTALSIGQAKFLYPVTVPRGATNVTLVTNYSFGEVTGDIQIGEVYYLSQKYDFNPDNPNSTLTHMDSSSGSRSSGQIIVVEGTNGNTISFSPPAYCDYTNQPALVQKYDDSGVTKPKRMVGVENITITLTNSGNYTTNGATELFDVKGWIDCWITGCKAEFGNNYGIKLTQSLFVDVGSNIVHKSLTSGTSHGGVLYENTCATYFFDNIIYDFSPGYHSGGYDCGNIFFANHVADTDGRAWIMHQPGANWNLYEANTHSGTNGGNWIGDSYFGPVHENSFYRNNFEGFSWKRWGSYNNAVGNSLGSTNFSLRYDMYAVGNTYEIFEMGYPNIGDLTTNGISPPTQRFFPGTKIGVSTSNYYVFTNISLQIVDGTNIQGNFLHWPATSAGYGLIFQDGVNTNRYWRLADFQTNVYDQIILGLGWISRSSTEMVLSTPMTISNGWTMLPVGPTVYQQRQTLDVPSHIRSWNKVKTNYTDAVVYDRTFLPLGYVDSIAHSEAPDWWIDSSGNPMTWPAVDPDRDPAVTGNPAKSRYDALVTTYTSVTNAPPRFRGFRFR